MTDETFKMPGSSYEELTKVIKAYGHSAEPAGLEDVSKLVGIHTTIISRNAGFLTSAGILDPGQKKIATSIGRSLAHALEHDIPEEIRGFWRKVILQTDFLSKVLTAIKIRNGMDSSTLEAHIAYSAGQPKKPQFMTGARTIIDILRAAEVVKESDGKIVFSDSSDLLESVPPSESSSSMSHDSQPQTSKIAHQKAVTDIQAVNSLIQIRVNITCTPNEIDGLGIKLRRLLENLRENMDTGTTAEIKE